MKHSCTSHGCGTYIHVYMNPQACIETLTAVWCGLGVCVCVCVCVCVSESETNGYKGMIEFSLISTLNKSSLNFESACH